MNYTSQKTLKMIEDHLCFNCQHKIIEHYDTNWESKNPSTSENYVCKYTHNELIIEKLLAWLHDALSERDAYKQSYETLAEEEKQREMERDLSE